MPNADPIPVVLAFEEAVNAGDVDAIVALMTEDGVFIDSLGSRITGHEKVREAWTQYFHMVPDYRISHSEIFSHGLSVVLIGEAHGTFSHDGLLHPENGWSTPTAWHAVVENGRILVWQVFADNEPIRQIMRRVLPPG